MKSAVCASLATTVAGSVASKPLATLRGQNSTFGHNGYLWNNNLYGEDEATSDQQCTYVFSDKPSGVSRTSTWTWESGDDYIKSYSKAGRHAKKGQFISDIKKMPTTVEWSYDDTNGINVDIAYDLFTDSNPDQYPSMGNYELMIWLGHYGSNEPIGSVIGHTKIGGIKWAVYNGTAVAGQQTDSFVAPKTVNKWSSDVVDFWNYLENKW